MLWIFKYYVFEWYVLYVNDENCMKIDVLFDGTLSIKNISLTEIF